MLKVGITGGIGSGKSTVCQVFRTLGIPVLYADETGRYLMDNDAMLIDSIKMLFGEDIYHGGILNRQKISSIVFNRPEILEQLNNLVHPAVVRYTQTWLNAQTTAYAIKEAAIFFESGTYRDMDVMIGVYAPHALRILRATSRDGISQEKVLARMSQQMDEDEKMKRCDHVIINDDKTAIIPQVLELHKILLDKAKA